MNATDVTVTFNLDSSTLSPPYNVSNNMTCVVTYDQNDANGNPITRSFNNFATEAIGTLAPGGATFTLNVVDANYAISATTVGNWALTCIPRNSATGVSPFQAQNSTITDPQSGQSYTNQGGTFTLNTQNAKLKNTGKWDWSLMVQMINVLDTTNIKCFASDPEMDIS